MVEGNVTGEKRSALFLGGIWMMTAGFFILIHHWLAFFALATSLLYFASFIWD